MSTATLDTRSRWLGRTEAAAFTVRISRTARLLALAALLVGCQAEQSSGGELMFTTTTHRAVLEPGAPVSGIELLVQRVGSSGAATLAACVEPSIADEFLRTLAAASGEAFETSATVTFGEETFRGCGRFL